MVQYDFQVNFKGIFLYYTRINVDNLKDGY